MQSAVLFIEYSGVNMENKIKKITSAPWWKRQVIYQIYPMSYCDTNGDGIGDLAGIIEKLDYIKSLGVGGIWLSPVYPSPNRDNGYDISDYQNVHKNYGTIDDMDLLIAECKHRDIKVIMDLVINHTSNEHDWFQKSRQRIEPYTDFYIWHPGVDGKKPSNWGSFFGEDCWEFDSVRKEYYLHLFAKEQPDLNYRNERVVEAVKEAMIFWLERGVDGFRCDVINILHKDSLKNGKWKPALTGSEYYISTKGTHDILKRLNSEVFSKYECYTVGETVLVDTKMAGELCNPDRHELDTIFSFEHMDTDCYRVKWFLRRFSAKRFFKTLTHWQNNLDWNTLYFENHDQPRSVSRFGNDKEYHSQSAKSLALLLMTLRGTAFLFEGQEIGMTNFDFQDMEPLRDIESKNIWKLTERLHFPKSYRWKMIKTKSRDNARTPMQWNGEKNAGFSSGTPWIDVNSNHKQFNVERQQGDEHSILSFYKKLIAFRNDSPVLIEGAFQELYNNGGVYIFKRTLGEVTLLVMVNLTAKSKKIPAKFVFGKVILSSYEMPHLDSTLKPYESVLLDV